MQNHDKHTTQFGEVPAAQWGDWDTIDYYFEPLAEYYRDPSVTEIMVNRFDNIAIEKSGELLDTPTTFKDEAALVRLIKQFSLALKQTIDDTSPVLDARFPDGSRACCTLNTVSPDGATLTIRRAPKQTLTLSDLVDKGAMSAEMHAYLVEKVRHGATMVVSGNTGSGKTTLLRALSEALNPKERIITCEDTQELHLKHLPHLIALEAPKRSTHTLDMKNLIETALRMRPDRIWVGEIRHAGACDAFLQAVNTGHSGCVTTIHANSEPDAMARMQYLIASAGLISYELAHTQILNGVAVFIHAARYLDDDHKVKRKITGISEIRAGVLTPVFALNKTTGEHDVVTF